MLLNLSNHLSSAWSEKQINAAAAQFGKVVDLPFPQINPDWKFLQIEEFSGELLMDILKDCEFRKYGKKNLTVHIMGELTFCYEMINALKIAGIPCVASTTTRNSIVDEIGKKISVFEFVKFREYFTKN